MFILFNNLNRRPVFSVVISFTEENVFRQCRQTFSSLSMLLLSLFLNIGKPKCLDRSGTSTIPKIFPSPLLPIFILCFPLLLTPASAIFNLSYHLLKQRSSEDDWHARGDGLRGSYFPQLCSAAAAIKLVFAQTTYRHTSKTILRHLRPYNIMTLLIPLHP